MTFKQACFDGNTVDSGSPIVPRSRGCAIPLTPDQRHMLDARIRFNPERRPLSVRMCACATRIAGPLNVGLLEGSVASLVRRHEALRTAFKTFEGVTTQQIEAPGECRLACVDLSELPSGEAEAEAKRLISEFVDQKIDLTIGPLFEARLFKISVEEHVLVILVDHMISDERSNAILEREVWLAYDNAVGDEPASLPPPRLQFGDYAAWWERTRSSSSTAHEDYWSQHRAKWMPIVIPASSDSSKCSKSEAIFHDAFGSTLTTQLRELAQRQRVALSNVVLVTYATAMSLWCGQENLIIRCPIHGRHCRPELDDVIGFFSSYVCLRIRISRQASFQSLLTWVHREMGEALAHRDFDKMQDLMPECVATELEFHWRSARLRKRAVQRLHHRSGVIKRQPFVIRSPIPYANFWCIFNETPSDVCVTVSYRPHCLRPNAAEHFVADMRSVARALIDRPYDPIDWAVSSRGH